MVILELFRHHFVIQPWSLLFDSGLQTIFILSHIIIISRSRRISFIPIIRIVILSTSPILIIIWRRLLFIVWRHPINISRLYPIFCRISLNRLLNSLRRRIIIINSLWRRFVWSVVIRTIPWSFLLIISRTGSFLRVIPRSTDSRGLSSRLFLKIIVVARRNFWLIFPRRRCSITAKWRFALCWCV